MPNPSATLAQLVEVLGMEEVRSLVQLYLDHTAAELQGLAAAPIDKQILKVHAIKGSSSQIGAKLFSAQCRSVEMRLRETRAPLTADELTVLQNEFATASDQLRDWLQKTPQGGTV
ncbi:MAG: Hpt domain-containing protein [Opitutaceae bacterium]|nr:Hpt domain-containing protein [Opitutaceae bacterium]